MCYGWLVVRDSRVIARGHGGYLRRSDATSNCAEYLALIEGLEALRDLGVRREPVQVVGDARSIIDQMLGAADVNSPRVRPLYRRAQCIARQFHAITWYWTKRRGNHAADALTRRALRQIRAGVRHSLQDLQVLLDEKPASFAGNGLLPVLDLRVYQPAGRLDF
jgi:ribonuclease HI